MLIAIVQHTPTWVFILFCGLLYLGLTRTQARTVKARRLPLLPLLIAAWSLQTIATAFAGSDLTAPATWALPAALAAWLVGAALLIVLHVARGARRDVVYLADLQAFRIPGSWMPLCWLIIIFCAKYAIGAGLAMHPELRTSASFAIVVGLLYGALSGNLAGGAWRILQLQLQDRARQAATLAGTL